MRAYTVAELDALRSAVKNKYLFGRYSGPTGEGMSRSFREDEMNRVIEERVRTHMTAGHTADDLVKSEGGEPGKTVHFFSV